MTLNTIAVLAPYRERQNSCTYLHNPTSPTEILSNRENIVADARRSLVSCQLKRKGSDQTPPGQQRTQYNLIQVGTTPNIRVRLLLLAGGLLSVAYRSPSPASCSTTVLRDAELLLEHPLNRLGSTTQAYPRHLGPDQTIELAN